MNLYEHLSIVYMCVDDTFLLGMLAGFFEILFGDWSKESGSSACQAILSRQPRFATLEFSPQKLQRQSRHHCLSLRLVAAQ